MQEVLRRRDRREAPAAAREADGGQAPPPAGGRRHGGHAAEEARDGAHAIRVGALAGATRLAVGALVGATRWLQLAARTLSRSRALQAFNVKLIKLAAPQGVSGTRRTQPNSSAQLAEKRLWTLPWRVRNVALSPPRRAMTSLAT